MPIGVRTIGLFLAAVLLLSFITKTNVYNAAIIIVIAFLFVSITDTIVSTIFVAILRTDLNNLMNHPLHYSSFAWSSKLIQASFALFLYKRGSERFTINIYKKNNSQYMYAALQLLLMALFIVSINYSISEVEDKSLYNIMLVALYILSLILSVFDIKEREQMLRVVNKKKTIDEYVKNLEEVINVIRREKHDFMNHMQTIYAICKLRKPNALESIDNYVKRLSSDLTMSYRFYETGNDYIDGLLAIKSHTCFQNDIDLSVNISANFSSAATDESDVAGILGNILNNAIECLLPLPDDYEKKIEIVTYTELDKFYLKIINNGPEIPKQMMNNIFDKGITSKADSEEHGLGLFIVKQMTLKNKGAIGVSSMLAKTEFTVTFNIRGGLNADSCERAIIQDQGV
jgi:two-component system, LytTR family, sensor histidine kinase AgrC